MDSQHNFVLSDVLNCWWEYPTPPNKDVLCTQCTIIKIESFVWIICCFTAYTYMHNTCTIFCLTKAKVLKFRHP